MPIEEPDPPDNPTGTNDPRPAEGVVQMKPEEAHQMAMICHLLSFLGLTGLIGIVTATPYPILGLLGPLALWLWKRKESDFVDQHGREAVNFNISFLIYSIALSILSAVGAFLIAAFFLGLLILIPAAIASVALLIFWIVVVIQAALAARDGKFYSYPLTFRFVK